MNLNRVAGVVLRSARTRAINLYGLMLILLWFSSSFPIEKVHPLQGGILRLKNRHERRPALGIEPIWRFYPRLAVEFLIKHVRLAWHGWRINRIRRRVAADPNGLADTDQAMMPVAADEADNLDLFTQTKAARDAVGHARKVGLLPAGAA